MSLIADDELYQGYLAKVYQDTQAFFPYSHHERESRAQTGVCIVYGELLYYSVKKVIKEMQHSPSDIFLDLGSGIGKLALQVFLESDVAKVVGIEALPILDAQAQKVAQQVASDYPFFWENGRELTFICSDFMKTSWMDATIIFACSTCFTPELLEIVGNRINQEPQVRQVLSLRPFPTLKMPLRRVFTVEGNWDTVLCFYYQV
ncbi:MAG TPA: hypothetical protein VHE99_00785 [Gammaproteobacteria bacterium]|nr:hypothetical protein [Gammaproteobacteria bacterium]